MPVVDQRSYFDARSSRYESGNWQGKDLATAETTAIGSLPTGLDVAVDLGSGPGRTVPELAKQARIVLAVDISSGMLGLRGHEHPALVADGRSLPLRPGVVDVCCLRMSVHYFSLPVLRDELVRVLKPHGWVVVTSIFPYGYEDEGWFNERHRLKGKSSVHTPCVEGLVDAFEHSFSLVSLASWLATHSVRSSLRSHPAGSQEKLVRHALTAPDSIRDLYRIIKNEDDDVLMTVSWSTLIFQVR